MRFRVAWAGMLVYQSGHIVRGVLLGEVCSFTCALSSMKQCTIGDLFQVKFFFLVQQLAFGDLPYRTVQQLGGWVCGHLK